jgi:peptidoglycan/LPS O-acetylase OafA/YrhL
MSGSHFSNLAGVRGLAAAVVLLAHVVQLHFLRFVGLGTPLHHISSVASEYAVVVFFILSGYLIAHTLEENVERNGRLRLDVFAAARIARLYPTFLFAICISLVVFAVLDFLGLPGRAGPMAFPDDLYAARKFVNLGLGDVGRALVMLQGMLDINGPLWSLYIEAKLYALYAIVIALVVGQRSLLQKLALMLVFYLVAKAGVKYNSGFLAYALIWMIGALAYYIWSDRRNWSGRLGVCCSLIVVIAIADIWRGWQSEAVIWSTARDVFVAMAIAWLLFKKRVQVPAGKRLADCSYSLYVTHFPVLLLGQALLIHAGNESLTATALMVALSVTVVFGVALFGGRIEAEKLSVQNQILALFSGMTRVRLCAIDRWWK